MLALADSFIIIYNKPVPVEPDQYKSCIHFISQVKIMLKVNHRIRAIASYSIATKCGSYIGYSTLIVIMFVLFIFFALAAIVPNIPKTSYPQMNTFNYPHAPLLLFIYCLILIIVVAIACMAACWHCMVAIRPSVQLYLLFLSNLKFVLYSMDKQPEGMTQ